MRIIKPKLNSKLILRLTILGFSIALITFAFAPRASKLPGQIAGTVTNPLLVDNKFCSDPASPDQQNCTSFISSVLAQSMSSPYQTVSGDVSISGNVGIGTASPVVKLQAGINPNYIGLEPRTDGMAIGGVSSTNAARVGGFYSTNPIPGAAIHFGAQGSGGQRGAIAFLTKVVDDNTTQPSAKMVITQAGTVGIGTANPGAKLAVDASGVSTGIFIGSGGTNSYGASLLEINAPAGYGNYIIEIGKNGSGIFHIDANGNEYAVTNNQLSDRRLKTNITPLAENNGLSAINQLEPVTFNWLSPDYAKTEQIGLIAQDVEKVFPQLVSEGGTTTMQLADGTSQTVTETKNLNYSGLIPPIVKAIQELDARTQYIQDAGGNLISNIATFGKLIAEKIQAGVIEAKQVIINGVDILEKLNSLSQKIEAQQKEIDLLKQEIEALKAR